VYFKNYDYIESCRTAELGGHVDECNECGHMRISCNSCRNRYKYLLLLWRGQNITKGKLNRQNYSPPGEINKIA